MEDKMILPVVLVTGFLGSGKTTFLQRLATRHPEWRIVFLVNEFAEISLDGGTLKATGLPTHSVVGGSLFCECKSSDFIQVMRSVLDPPESRPLPDLLVIETSGIADPESIGKLIGWHGLDRRCRVHSIITIVSSPNFPKVAANLPAAEAQVRVSDWVVMNKMDLANPAQIQATRECIERINPQCRVLESSFCDQPFKLMERSSPLPAADLSTCESNPYTAVVAQTEAVPAAGRLRGWLEKLPDFILRVKGHARVGGLTYAVEKTIDGADIHLSDPSPEKTLVFIVKDEDEAALLRFFTQSSIPITL